MALIAVATLLTPSAGGAAASHYPPNDSFYAATHIATLPFEDPNVSNWDATLDYEEFDPSCSEVDSTVWYKIVPTSNYSLRVRAIPVTGIDVVVAVYDGTSYGTLREKACADSYPAYGAESTIVQVFAGHTYYIQVGGDYWFNPRGTFTVKAARIAPKNDNFANGLSVGLGSTSYATTTHATLEAGEPSSTCGPIGRTVWYRYKPSTTRTVVAGTGGSNFDTILAVYRGSSLGTLSQVACNDDRGTGVTSKVRVTLQGGVTYHFQVGGYSGASGSLVFRLKTP